MTTIIFGHAGGAAGYRNWALANSLAKTAKAAMRKTVAAH